MKGITIRQLNRLDIIKLYIYFKELVKYEESHFFSPHKFNLLNVFKILYKYKSDYYSGIFIKGEIIGYGLLRGWDEGYEIPSLGISIKKEYRSKKFSILMMEYLHSVARLRNSKKIMLKVNKKNIKAIRLYESTGYDMQEFNQNFLIGYKTL